MTETLLLRLTGPCRETDARIAHAVRWRWEGWEDGDVQIEDRAVEYVNERVENGYNSIWRGVPRYTASLDDAALLIPDGFDWVLEHVNGGLTIGARVGHNERDQTVFGNSAALALCAAALYAKAG